MCISLWGALHRRWRNREATKLMHSKQMCTVMAYVVQRFSQGSIHIHFLNFRELISCQQFCKGLDHIYHMSTTQFLWKIWLSDVGIHTHVIDLPSCKYMKSLWTTRHWYLISRQRKSRNPVVSTHEKIEALFTVESCNLDACTWKKIVRSID